MRTQIVFQILCILLLSCAAQSELSCQSDGNQVTIFYEQAGSDTPLYITVSTMPGQNSVFRIFPQADYVVRSDSVLIVDGNSADKVYDAEDTNLPTMELIGEQITLEAVPVKNSQKITVLTLTFDNTEPETDDTAIVSAQNIILDSDDPVCIGDINGDGVINKTDISALVAFISEYGDGPIWMIYPPFTNPAVDVNGDGRVNKTDISALVSYLAVHGSAPLWRVSCP